MDYLLSDGTLTKSRKIYLQDAIKFGFSIDSNSVPNSNLGIHFNRDTMTPAQKLIFNNICKSIDKSLRVTKVEQDFNKIYVTISYPYGELKMEM